MTTTLAIPRGWLLDTSALPVAHEPSVSSTLGALLAAGALYTCPLLDAEALASASSPGEYTQLAADRRLAYRPAPYSAAIGARSAELQAVLARRSHLQSVAPGDLLVAATALEHGLCVLHHSTAFTVLGDLCGLDQVLVASLGGPR